MKKMILSLAIIEGMLACKQENVVEFATPAADFKLLSIELQEGKFQNVPF